MPPITPIILAMLPPTPAAELFGGYGFYIGDPHVHTGASGDGGSSDLGSCSGDCGAVAELDDLARGYGLDFFAVTDHSNGDIPQSGEDFATVLAYVMDMHDPAGGMVTVVGGELWFSLDGDMLGHKNLYLFADNADLEGLRLLDIQPDEDNIAIDACEDIWDWMATLQHDWGPALLLAHHPAMTGRMSTTWDCHQGSAAASFAPAVEMYSGHGDSSRSDTSFDPLWLGDEPECSVHDAMDPDLHNLRMGFVGGTDAHDNHPSACRLDSVLPRHPYGGGLTVAVLPEHVSFDRQPLYEAMTERRTYASSGPLLPALVAYGSGGATLGAMGQDLGLPDGQPLDVAVAVPDEHAHHVASVIAVGDDYRRELEPDGDARWSLQIDVDPMPAWVYVEIVVDGESWYGGEDCEDGGDDDYEHLWLSPSWLEDAEPDLDGDGVSWADGDCDDGDAQISPEADEDCSSGLDEDCDELIDDDDPDCDEGPGDSDPPDDPGDTAPPEDSEPPQDEPPGDEGCAGCHAASSGPASALLLLLPLILRRRP